MSKSFLVLFSKKEPLPSLLPEDPLATAAGKLGLLLAANQPFYPLYAGWLTGVWTWQSAAVLWVMPVFAAVPLLARRSALAARLLLPVAGIANTVLMARLLGPQAGLDYLLIPCAALGAILFRATERKAMLAVVGLALAAWLLADGPPGVLFDAAGYAALQRMNAISAIALCGLIGWLTPRAAPLLPPRA